MKYQVIQVKGQQLLAYITEFKCKCSKMKEQLGMQCINIFLLTLKEIFIDDVFISRRLMFMLEATNRRSLELKNNFQEGTGAMRYSNGGIYAGEFIGGKPEGRGVWVYPDGLVYDGEFKSGILEGKAFVRFPGGLRMIDNSKMEDRKVEDFLFFIMLRFIVENLKMEK